MNLLFKIFGGNYDDLWKALIRPIRDTYTKQDLGPMKFEIGDKCYKRTDFELINKRALKIMCSYWEPFDEERESPRLPCVIYLHGNSSSRCEAYQEVSYLLTKNITVFSFDFCGCGQSEGDFISLGYYEKQDVHCVIEYLIKSKKVSKIALWGRSMGAVTAIMYANEQPSLIDAMVLDSGFYSLKLLIDELIGSKIKLPKFIFDKVLQMVKETIREKANFELDVLEPYIYAKNCLVPAFFCHGKEDDFVLPHHSQDLFNEYKGSYKYIEMVKGGHNSVRPKKLIHKICNFLKLHLKENDESINETEKIIENDNSDEYDEEEEDNEDSIDKNDFNEDKLNFGEGFMKYISLNKEKNINDNKGNKLIKANNSISLSIKFKPKTKEKTEENISSSNSSNKKGNKTLYRKKLIKKELFNEMNIKSKVMSEHFYNYKNKPKGNNLKLYSIYKYSNSTNNENNANNYQNKNKNRSASNSQLNSISLKKPYIKKNNKINQIDKTYTSQFYIKNANSTNFIQNNFYMTNNSYYNRLFIKSSKYKNAYNKKYFSLNDESSEKNKFKSKEKIVYKKKLKKKLLSEKMNISLKSNK